MSTIETIYTPPRPEATLLGLSPKLRATSPKQKMDTSDVVDHRHMPAAISTSETVTTSSRPEATLLGLSSEIRIQIFTHLFHKYYSRDFMTIFHIYTRAYNLRPFSHHTVSGDNYLGILRVCRLIHEEAMEVLYSDLSVTACVFGVVPGMTSASEPLETRWDLICGRPETMGLWQFVQRLDLCAFMSPGKRNGLLVVERLRTFVNVALQGGIRLKKLRVMLVSEEDRGMPKYLGEVLEVLRELRVEGKVRVVIDYDVCMWDEEFEDYGRECEELERVIKGG